MVQQSKAGVAETTSHTVCCDLSL